MAVRKGYKLTEIGENPENWEVTTFGNIAPLQRGYDLPQNQIEHGKYPVVFSNGILCHNKHFKVNGPGVVTGRSGTIGSVFYIDENYWPHNTTLYVTDFNGNYPKFIYYLYLFNNIKKFASGSGVPTLNRNEVHPQKVGLPPFEEQIKISNIFSDIDSLIASLERLIDKKRLIKQGAMQELLTGKKRLPGFEREWTTLSLKDCAVSIREFTTNEDNYLICIELENLEQNSGKLIGNIVKIKDVNSIKLKFQINDILFSKLRAYLRKYFFAETSGACSSEIWVLRAITLKVLPHYLYQVIQTNAFIDAASISYGTHMPRSDWNIIKNFPIYLSTSSTEQAAIASVLSDMDDEIAALEAKLAKTRQIKSGMMEELLTGRIRLV